MTAICGSLPLTMRVLVLVSKATVGRVSLRFLGQARSRLLRAPATSRASARSSLTVRNCGCPPEGSSISVISLAMRSWSAWEARTTTALLPVSGEIRTPPAAGVLPRPADRVRVRVRAVATERASPRVRR